MAAMVNSRPVVNIESLTGRESVRGLKKLTQSQAKADVDIRKVKVHLTKYFRTDRDFYSIANAFNTWKSKSYFSDSLLKF